MTRDIEEACVKAKTWAIDAALPLWSSAGFDAASGRFQERLDLAGRPIPEIPRRLMVQCRQIAVYALADELGWCHGRDIVRNAVEHLERSYFQADGAPGWIFSIDADGSPADVCRDSYAHAFVLLALGWAYRTLGTLRLIDLADQTLAFIDRQLASPLHGGLIERAPPSWLTSAPEHPDALFGSPSVSRRGDGATTVPGAGG